MILTVQCGCGGGGTYSEAGLQVLVVRRCRPTVKGSGVGGQAEGFSVRGAGEGRRR